MKKLSCRDAGFDCDYTIGGYTEQELFRNGQKHVFNIHGMKKEEFTPQFNERLRPLLRETITQYNGKFKANVKPSKFQNKMA